MFVCSTNLGFSGGSANRYCCRTLRQYDTRYLVRIMYQIRMYVPGISRQKSIRTYVMFLFLFPLFVSARHPHLFGNKSTWNFVYDRLLGAKKKTRRRFCTRRERFPRGLLNSWIFNFQTRYTAKTRYTFACLNIARPAADARPAVPLAITRSFRPWTHKSDDSYIYQLSLVVATATVSLYRIKYGNRRICYHMSFSMEIGEYVII